MVPLLISMLLGAAIGLERQLNNHKAGLRTFTLISMGSTLAMLISTNLYSGDPGRIAAQVISGIGFLGAGIILHYEDKVYGLTTAACVWITAVIGLAVGAFMYVEAIGVTCLTIILLIIFERFKK
jgi:putative Mg2+ transporter-C (MgtC) family protein